MPNSFVANCGVCVCVCERVSERESARERERERESTRQEGVVYLGEAKATITATACSCPLACRMWRQNNAKLLSLGFLRNESFSLIFFIVGGCHDGSSKGCDILLWIKQKKKLGLRALRAKL